jgi:RNA polymerase sigma-70 factor, ECF subfamily
MATSILHLPSFRPFILLCRWFGCSAQREKVDLQPRPGAGRIKQGMTDEDVQTLLDERRWNAAFELLLDLYQQRVFRLVYSILNEAAKAEEVTQDIFLKMWQILPDYDKRASVATWLYTIARNRALSALRAESRRKTLPIEDYDPPATISETRLRQLEIEQLLRRLPELQQRVITLFYLQDCSVEEVARMLGLPEGTVKSHLHRARRALGELMRS